MSGDGWVPCCLRVSIRSQCDLRSRRHGASRPTCFLDARGLMPSAMFDNPLSQRLRGLRAPPKPIHNLAAEGNSTARASECSTTRSSPWKRIRQHAREACSPRSPFLVWCRAPNSDRGRSSALPAWQHENLHHACPVAAELPPNALLILSGCPARSVRCLFSARNGESS